MARKQHKYHYIYKITCLKNGRYYIGMHSTSNLEDGYFGGGKRIKNSIKKHGKEFHKKEILEFFEDREKLRNRESELVNEELIKDPMCMNLQLGGGGGITNEEHLKKFLESGSIEYLKRMKDPEYLEIFKKKCSNAIKKRWDNSEQRDLLIKSLRGKGFNGKKHTQESRDKIGKSNSKNRNGEKNFMFGKKWILHREFGEKIINGDELNEYLSLGWQLGRTSSKKFK